MYKKFAIVVLLLAPVLSMIASNYTASISRGRPPSSNIVPVPVNAPNRSDQPAVEMAQPATDEASNAASIAIAPTAGAPMLDPKGIEPAPVSLSSGPPPPAAPAIKDITPTAPPSKTRHDGPVDDQPAGI